MDCEPKLSIFNIDVASPRRCLGIASKVVSSKLLQLVTIHRLLLFLPLPAILVGPTLFRNRYPSFG